MSQTEDLPSQEIADTGTDNTGTQLESLKSSLQDVSDQLHSEFQGPGAAARLEQFDAHMGTLLMTIDHIFDEADRMRGPKGEDIYRTSGGD